MNRENVTRLIYGVIDDLNAQFPDESKLEKRSSFVLFGDSGSLDSLGLVSLIVAVEDKINEEYGFTISLADEKAMSQESSPFKTIGTLVEYLSVLINDHSSNCIPDDQN